MIRLRLISPARNLHLASIKSGRGTILVTRRAKNEEATVERICRFSRTRRALIELSIGVSGIFLLLPSSARALEAGLARIQDDHVQVGGKGAAKDSPVYWQGVPIATSTGGGTFSFTTQDIPVTCVGELSDGVTTVFIAVSGCTAAGVTVPSSLALVAATGQTTSYAIGDDGYHQQGVASPTPRFTDNLDGTITDNLTGLIWLEDAGCLGEWGWIGALDAVDELADGKCGLTDGSVAGSWRLPNRNELASLRYGGSGLPPGHPFAAPAEPSDYFWSSTTYPWIPDTAWATRLFEDGAETRDSKNVVNPVIAVRGGF